MRPRAEEFLGIDVGERRVGIARGSSLARIAEPLKTVEAERAVEGILSLAALNHTDGVVVGLPRSLNGQETEQTKAVRLWVKQAQAVVKLPFYFQDEALSTKTAEWRGPAAAGHDAVAAAIILQDFLDMPESDRVKV